MSTRAIPSIIRTRRGRIAEATPGAFYVNQFENPANPAAHEASTGPEIWRQMEGRLDAVVCGVGTGGTLTGVAHFMARVAPHVEMVLADPAGSILAPLVNDGDDDQAGNLAGRRHRRGLHARQLRPLARDARLYDHRRRELRHGCAQLLQKEGILAGSSSGTLLAAALRYCREQTEPKRVVTFVCDSGNKYLSKIYNDYWIDDHGLTIAASRMICAT